MRETCGYKGHYCSEGSVQFISRYRFVNDYCVGGKRVSVDDTGHVSANATNEDLQAILSFERARYSEYLEWHKASPIMQGTPLPFDAGIGKSRIAEPIGEQGMANLTRALGFEVQS